MAGEPSPAESRRTFLTSAAAVAAGGAVVATPLAVGVASFLSPLARSGESSEVRVALLEQVPDDGVPRFFPVIADRTDAWSRYEAQRIGAVYLVRDKGAETPTAFTAKCPHAGCFIGFSPGDKEFKCPCHTSTFKLDGKRARGDREVAPRDMDKLPVTIRSTKSGDQEIAEVWVEFIDFQTGRKEQVRST